MLTSEYVKIVSNEESVPPMPEDPALKTPYLPDRWQQFAIHAIENEENVLATCPTGSGKSFVAEYQCAKSIQKGKRVFFTTPIKSLSNQKYYDLKKLFPDVKVGIYTGDIKQSPDAQILVMTTEILRNLLFKRGTATEKVGTTSLLSLDGLDAVVFDEVHYINDPDRGHVWEETLMLLPPEIHLILLSATLSSPYTFAKWIGENKQKKIWLISTLWRAVPLEHCVREMNGSLTKIMDSRETYDAEAYRKWRQSYKDGYLAQDKFKEKVKEARRAGHEGPVEGKVRLKSFEHQLNETLDTLHVKGNLPCIVFQFSRQGCERLAALTHGTFIDSSDCAAVKHIWSFHLNRFKASLETSPQYHKLYELVQKGVAFHHSGLLPFLKEILEILFNKGYIKVLYATETFAVGINMPTKTVLFTSLEKFTDGEIRMLKTSEYIQMAGRAGRRGKDDRGLVIYLPQKEPLETYEMASLMKGQAQTFCSRMNFHYDFVLKLLHQKHDQGVLVKGSYWYRLEEESLLAQEKELVSLKTRRSQITLSEAQKEACEEKADIEKRIATTQNAKKKTAQRELQRWLDDHPVSVWKGVLERYEVLRAVDEDIQKAEGAYSLLHKQHEEIHVAEVQQRKKVLEECGFLGSDGVLTHKGHLASEMNEGHPFLTTELFLRSKSKSKKDILLLLALFLGESSKSDKNVPIQDLDVCKEVKEELSVIMKQAEELFGLERKLGLHDPSFWELNTEWIEPIQRWLEGYTLAQIATEFELFEGNIQRCLMKLEGLVEEFIALATLCADIDMLKELEGCRELILRDIVIAESLYLRI